MLKQSCLLCKIVGLLAIVGSINWGLVGIFGINMVDQVLGIGTMLSKVVYGLVGVSGVLLLLSFFITCPGCKCKT